MAKELTVNQTTRTDVRWHAKNSVWSKCFSAFCKTIFNVYCPLKVHGRQNLPKPPFLICSNHRSHMDSAVLVVAADLLFRDTGFIAAKDYFFDQSHRLFLQHLINLVPIARGSGPGAIKDSIAVCDNFLHSGGKALVMFPEGTRASSEKMGKFKDGAAILAHELNLPMVPAYIKGAGDSLPKGSYFIRPHRIDVSFGPSFMVGPIEHQNDEEYRKKRLTAIREATLEMEKRVHELQDQTLKYLDADGALG